MELNIKGVLDKKTHLYHVLPPIILLLGCLLITLWAVSAARDDVRTEEVEIASRRSENTTSSIAHQMSTYEEILRGAVGLFMASANVSKEEWDRYVASFFDTSGKYKEITSVGFIDVVRSADLPAYLEEKYSSGAENYMILPDGERGVYAPIVYVNPSTEANKNMVGKDVYTDPIWREAMERSRDEGDISFTDSLELEGIAQGMNPKGFIALIPVYDSIPPDGTVDQRRDMLSGFVYATVLAEASFAEVAERRSDRNGFRIYMGSSHSDDLLYESPTFQKYDDMPGSITHAVTYEDFGVKWIMDYRYSPEVVSQTLRERPLYISVTGLTLGSLAALLLYMLLMTRTRSLAQLKDKEVQGAKDDLLSLASHQLRTPATGVKQYIGMVLEGYAGSVGDQQRMYLEKAYDSNERQLRIINDLLYVARIDAGRIVLTKRKININDLVKNIIAKFKEEAKAKDISLEFKVPARSRIVFADKHSLSMAIENLVSNSVKYTPNGGTVRVSVTLRAAETLVIVKDSGVGISDENKKMLFHRFSRISNEMSVQESGSGVGLYLAMNLMQLHGGTIDVKDAAGKGTKFIARLPYES